MGREKVKLTPEKIRSKIRYKRMVKGALFKSRTFDSDSRDNKRSAWNDFIQFRKEVLSQHHLQNQSRLYQQLNASITSVDHSHSLPEGWNSQDRNESVQSTKTNLTVKFQVDRFLTEFKNKVMSKQKSIGRFGAIRSSLNYLSDWLGTDFNLSKLSTETVRNYFNHLLKQIEKGASSHTCYDHFQIFKQFVEDCAEEYDEIPYPNNLRSKKYQIKKRDKEPITFSVEEVKLFLDNSIEKTKLYFLLMLNCGMYQGDISNLKANEVDWKAGRIIRKRSKTKNEAHVPTVNYKLWNETFNLLTKHGSRRGHVLLNEKGEKLLRSGIKENGKEWKTDNIKSACDRVKNKLITGESLPITWRKTYKQLRKTGANIIAINGKPDMAELYLAQSSQKVVDRNYLKAGLIVPELDEALTMMGKQLLG